MPHKEGLDLSNCDRINRTEGLCIIAALFWYEVGVEFKTVGFCFSKSRWGIS